MAYSQETSSSDSDEDRGTETLGFPPSPTVALLAAGAIGLIVGAVVWQSRKVNRSKFAALDRAIDVVRAGAVDTYSSLHKRLRAEGYAPEQIERHAKKFLSQLIDRANRHI